MQTLKHIAVNIYADDYLLRINGNLDPLFDIPSEFENVPNKKIIETVTIKVSANASCTLRASWGRLDEVLTNPGWFSLRRVSLIIVITSNFSRKPDKLERELRKLPETHLPRLSSSNSVSIDINVKR